MARVEYAYQQVFQEVDLALSRGDHDRAVSMIRNAASGHPKVIPSPEIVNQIAKERG